MAHCPPSVSIVTSCLCFFTRLQKIPSSTLPGQAFQEAKRLHSLGYNTWYGKVCELAQNYNINLDSASKESIKNAVIDQFKANWKSDINNLDKNPSLRTYIHVKTDFKMEPYLILVKNYKYRNALSKLRASSHTLEIERGRHTNPITPIEQRLCFHCNVVETELHFLTECELYRTERNLLFTNIIFRFPYFIKLDNFCKFKFMLTFSDEQLLSSVGKFIYLCFEKRKSLTDINL